MYIYFIFSVYILEISGESIRASLKLAEEYLAHVVNNAANCKNFDELRLWSYHHKVGSIEDLPPTSNSINLHILRAFYVVYSQLTCLDMTAIKLDPTMFGFVLEDGKLKIKKITTFVPPVDELLPPCNCKVCSTKACPCNKKKHKMLFILCMHED